MPISNTTNRWDYVGDGTTTTFQYDNLIFEASDLKIFLNGSDTAEQSGFSISNVGQQNGGNVTFAVAPSADVAIAIVRDVPQTQQSTLRDFDGFPALLITRNFDKVTVLVQQVSGLLDRGLRLSESDASVDMRLPQARQNQFLAFDAQGRPIASPGTPGNIPVSAFWAGLLDDTDEVAIAALIIAQVLQQDQNWSGSQRSPYVDNGTSLTFDMDAGQKFKAAPAAGTQSLAFTNLADGQDGRLRIDNTSGSTINFGPECEFAGGAPPSIGQGVAVLSYDTDGTKVTITVLDEVASS